MRRDVKKAISWIEDVERKATSEIERIQRIDSNINTEVSTLQEKIAELKDNQKILNQAKTKIDNLVKMIQGK